MPKDKTRNTQSVNKIWPVSKHSMKAVTSKLVPVPFVFAKNYTQLQLENEIFETTCLY